jgi:septal ring factor EnvC (AmiA/AmiB activator)
VKWKYKSLGVMLCVVPVSGHVVRQFDPPACERCAGHRGVTVKTNGGETVVATATGVVEFAGSVGGRLYVVQRVSPMVRVTYGWLSSISATEGVAVGAGEVIGVAADTTYLSVRVGEIHVEPLRALGLGRARLVPTP